MMMDFGELRSRLAGQQDSQGWALVRRWAEQAWEAEPERFEEQWLPYLMDRVGQWRAKVCDCPTAWKRQIIEGRYPPIHLARALHFQADEPRLHEILEGLSRMGALRGAQTLALRWCVLGAGELERLAGLELPALRALDLSGAAQGGARSAPLGELAGAGWLGQVERLTIDACDVGEGALKALIAGGLGASLRSLSAVGLKRPEPGDSSLASLLAAAPNLQQLDWRQTPVSADALAALSQAPCAASLTSLRLGGVRMGATHYASLGAAHVEALSRARLPALRELTTSEAGLDAQACGRLLEWASELPALRALDVSANLLDASSLAAIDALWGLSELKLSYNWKLGDAGARIIGAAPWSRLSTLEVRSCGMSPAGVLAMVGAGSMRGLKALDVGDNGSWERAQYVALDALVGEGVARRLARFER